MTDPPRKTRTLMPLRDRRISGIPRTVRKTEAGLHAGWTKERGGYDPSFNDVVYPYPREILDPIRHLLGVQHLADHLQIQRILTHGGGELTPIDEPGEEHTRGLTCPGNRQGIVVLTEQHALERGRAVKQRCILQAGLLILLCGHHIDPALP
jgi:hypothetical protein